MNRVDGMRYGPWALVTGASDGIGQAFARQLAKDGLKLVVVARRRERLVALADELAPAEVRIVEADLALPEGVVRVEEAVAGLDLGLVVASAGFGTSGDFLANPREAELSMIDVNCRAVAALTHALAPRLVQRGRGGVVLLSSLVAFQGVPGSANYAATKAWVQSFAEGLGFELRRHGVDVLSVAPGPVASGFAARANMVMANAETPEIVATQALGALGRRSLVRPGFLSKLLAWSLSTLPRWGRVLVMARVMAGMAKRPREPEKS